MASKSSTNSSPSWVKGITSLRHLYGMAYSSCSMVAIPFTASCITFSTRCSLYSPTVLKTSSVERATPVLRATLSFRLSVVKLRVAGVSSTTSIQSHCSSIFISHSTLETTLSSTSAPRKEIGSEVNSSRMSGSDPSCSTEISCSKAAPAPAMVILTLPVRLAPSVFSVTNRRSSSFPVPLSFDKVSHIFSASPTGSTTAATQSAVAVISTVEEPATLESFSSFFDSSRLSASTAPFSSPSSLHAPNKPANNMNKKVLIVFICFSLVFRFYFLQYGSPMPCV